MTTTEEATRLFHKAGEIAEWKPGIGTPLVINYLRVFANLVRAEENEECAKLCVVKAEKYYDHAKPPYVECAESIRARRK